MRVLLTDGENRATLALTRALGQHGHHVIVGDRRARTLAKASRYCTEKVIYPDPVSDSDGFIEALSKLSREHHVDVLIPVTDITTFLVTQHRDRFSCAVPCASATVVARAADKVGVLRCAERLGVPVPRSVIVADPREMPPAEHLGYPLVIKPWQSRIHTSTGWVSTSVSYADTPAQLARDLLNRPLHEFPVLLQERLIGPGVGVFACMHEGRPVATFSHRRLRERPPWGGVSVLCESAPVDPVAGDQATRLLAAIGWQGVAMVEFKRDLRDGVPKLMEINGRFWGSLQLAIDAGVDFPALLMQTVTGDPFPPQPAYRVGIRERWFWGDVDALLVSLRPGGNAARLAGRSKVRAVRDFLPLRAPELHYDNPKWHDPWPFLTETRTWFTNIARGVRRNRTPRGIAAARIGANAETPPPALNGPVRIHTASSFADVGLDEHAWNDLVASSDTNSVFLTHQWARSWSTALGKDRTLLFVQGSDASGVVRALLPLAIDSGHRPGSWRVGRFIGDGRADYSDVLAPADAPALIESVVEALLTSSDWDSLDLRNIPERSQAAQVIKRCCERAGFPVVVDRDTVCPTLIIEGRDAEVRQILNKPSLRRRQNYFARTGSMVVRHLTTATEILPLLDTFFEQHVSRWAESPSPSLFMKQRNREFYRLLTRNLSDTSWLLFTVVELDGRPIAMHYGFDYSGVVTWYKPSFDPAFAAHSPGLVLLHRLIEYAATRRRRELDFTWGDEPFKARFTNHVRRTIHLQIYRDSVRYNLDRANRLLRAVARRATTA